MKAFDFDSRLIDRYATFSRSFTEIRAEDLKTVIEAEYTEGRFWPESLLSLNPRFKAGPSIDDLVSSGDLDDSTGAIFRFGSSPLRLHRHQAQALAKAKAGKSYVVTTGTGSGKSLCFFIPIVDTIVRALKVGSPRRTRAIIIYPMNALANRTQPHPFPIRPIPFTPPFPLFAHWRWARFHCRGCLPIPG